MRDGVSRGGGHLYPALPYEHFTHVTDQDLDAIYAFLMTRRPVPQPAPPNHLIPPLGFRPLLAGWKMRHWRLTWTPYGRVRPSSATQTGGPPPEPTWRPLVGGRIVGRTTTRLACALPPACSACVAS